MIQEDKHLNVRKAKRATGIVIVVRFVETVTAGEHSNDGRNRS